MKAMKKQTLKETPSLEEIMRRICRVALAISSGFFSSQGMAPLGVLG